MVRAQNKAERAKRDRALLLALRRASKGGADSMGGAGLFLPFKPVQELDAKIDHLGAEIAALSVPPFKPGDDVGGVFGLGAEQTAFKLEYGQFVQAWNLWMAKRCASLAPTGETVCGFGDSFDEFRSFEGDYNEFRRRFVEDFGGQTTTEKSKEKVDTPSAANEIASAAKWVAVAAIAFIGYQVVKT